MIRKLRVAIQNIAYCGGCEVALADLGETLLDLLDREIDLVYAPLFMSAKDFEDIDVMLITGAVRNEEDLEKLQKARAASTYLVAFGSCANFGGIPGLANLYTHDDLFDAAYKESVSVREQYRGTRPGDGLPALLDKVLPVEAHVKVDLVLPGCPPPPPLIADFLEAVLAKIPVEEVETVEH